MIQITGWSFANVLLTVIIYLQLQVLTHSFQLPVSTTFWNVILFSIVIGSFQGITLGISEYYMSRHFFRRLSVGRIILFQTFLSLMVLWILFEFIRYTFYESFIGPLLFNSPTTLSHDSWRYIFLLLVIYFLVVNMILSFVNQMNKKYGPGVLLPILLGKYRKPKEEQRIFMFMDLKSSTTIAENLGHIKYSSLIQDYFNDINHVVVRFDGEIYQYVGDEVVISWEDESRTRLFCLQFFFACEKEIQGRSEYYLAKYGMLPVFKAGIHAGKVTSVEIGEIKRDIAFHGDTLNTASRIQELCNAYDKRILISGDYFKNGDLEKDFQLEPLGKISLKGKMKPVEIVSVKSRI